MVLTGFVPKLEVDGLLDLLVVNEIAEVPLLVRPDLEQDDVAHHGVVDLGVVERLIGIVDRFGVDALAAVGAVLDFDRQIAADRLDEHAVLDGDVGMIAAAVQIAMSAGPLELVLRRKAVLVIAAVVDIDELIVVGHPLEGLDVFGPLADASVNVDMIVQSTAADGASTDITFTVGKADFGRTMDLLDAIKVEVGCESVLSDQDVVKISVIGVGMRSHAGVALAMFRTLAEKGINIQVISTSEIKISVLVAEEYTELALRALHTAYGLDAD